MKDAFVKLFSVMSILTLLCFAIPLSFILTPIAFAWRLANELVDKIHAYMDVIN